MKKSHLIVPALLAVLVGCNRSGMIDNTGSSGVASSSSSPRSASSPGSASSPSSSARAASAQSRLGTKPIGVARIGYGEMTDITPYVAPGRTTIFDFTSQYCGPCRAIAPHLHRLQETRDDIVVVEVDVNRVGVEGIDWKSPLVAQFGLESIPAFKIYGPNGQLQAEGQEARQLVDRMVQE